MLKHTHTHIHIIFFRFFFLVFFYISFISSQQKKFLYTSIAFSTSVCVLGKALLSCVCKCVCV